MSSSAISTSSAELPVVSVVISAASTPSGSTVMTGTASPGSPGRLYHSHTHPPSSPAKSRVSPLALSTSSADSSSPQLILNSSSTTATVSLSPNDPRSSLSHLSTMSAGTMDTKSRPGTSSVLTADFTPATHQAQPPPPLSVTTALSRKPTLSGLEDSSNHVSVSSHLGLIQPDRRDSCYDSASLDIDSLQSSGVSPDNPFFPSQSTSPSSSCSLNAFHQQQQQQLCPSLPDSVVASATTLLCDGLSSPLLLSCPVVRGHLDLLPFELVVQVFLMLSSPAEFLAVSKRFHRIVMDHPIVIAKWLTLHNHMLPSQLIHTLIVVPTSESSSNTSATSLKHDNLRPAETMHPLLACLKHKSRYQILHRNGVSIAHALFQVAPLTSRYDLQRMYRRAVAPDRCMFAIAGLIAARSCLLFGTPVVTTASGVGSKQYQNAALLLNPQTTVQIGGGFEMDTSDFVSVVARGRANRSTTMGASNSTDPSFLHSEAALMEALTSLVGTSLNSDLPPPPDDRRLLLDAAVSGDVSIVSIICDAHAICLDGRVMSDAFSRAWDRGDPGRLCTPDGWLWPRCQVSRWFVLEKLVKVEEATFHAAAASGLWLGEIQEFVDGVVEVVRRILHEATQASLHAEELGNRQKVAEGPLPMDWTADINDQTAFVPLLREPIAKTLANCRPLYPSLWRHPRSFLDRALDLFVMHGTCKMVELALAHNPTLHPRHVSAAIERADLSILAALVDRGADPEWHEDPSLCGGWSGVDVSNPNGGRGVMPVNEVMAASFWRDAVGLGVAVTPRRWEKIVSMGPRCVAAVLEASKVVTLVGTRNDSMVDVEDDNGVYETRVNGMDPCRDNMIAFRLGCAEVIRVASDEVDASFGCGDALAAAAYGDVRAIQYCVKVGEIIAENLAAGRKEKCCDLLDAGAIVLDNVLVMACAIAEAPPGGWEEWPIAARCLRRILVQRRLRLPVPTEETLRSLPKNVLTQAFLASFYATRPLCEEPQALVYCRYQRRRHPNTAGIRINLVPVLEHDIAHYVMMASMDALKELLSLYDDPVFPGEAYCFIKGMLQYGLRDKNLLREEDEFILPDDEWEEVAHALTSS